MIVTRFAPSPTGQLHLGHAWSAILAHDLARASGGTFLLRIEDIDRGRCRAEFVTEILNDLRWLGLDWDKEVAFQSQRSAHYASALARLQAKELVYRCWCTRAEIAAAGGAPQGDEGPVYPGICRGRADPADGRTYCWRLDMVKAVESVGPISWHDATVGEIRASPEGQGDVVIARKDADTSYHLAVTLDDAAQGVTDIVRERDLFAATDIHRLLQAVLGLPTPRYHHHRLVLSADGERLAKRRQSPTLAELRKGGADPKHVVDAMRQGRFPFGFALEAD